MNEANQQKIFQARGIVSLTECFLDKEGLTKKEIEFLQQALGGAASLLSGIVAGECPEFGKHKSQTSKAERLSPDCN